MLCVVIYCEFIFALREEEASPFDNIDLIPIRRVELSIH